MKESLVKPLLLGIVVGPLLLGIIFGNASDTEIGAYCAGAFCTFFAMALYTGLYGNRKR